MRFLKQQHEAHGMTQHTPVEQPSAVKYDAGKPPVAAVYPEFVLEMAEVLGHGDSKYGKANWIDGLGYERLMSAAQRHMLMFQGGESSDPESGKSHLAHAACCLMMLHFNEQHRNDLDDRRFKK